MKEGDDSSQWDWLVFIQVQTFLPHTPSECRSPRNYPYHSHLLGLGGVTEVILGLGVNLES